MLTSLEFRDDTTDSLVIPGCCPYGCGLLTGGAVGNVLTLMCNSFGGQAMLKREGYLRVKEAAELLGVCANTVRAWGAEGKIPEYRHPVNKYRLFKRVDLEKINRKLERSGPGATAPRPRLRAK